MNDNKALNKHEIIKTFCFQSANIYLTVPSFQMAVLDIA